MLSQRRSVRLPVRTLVCNLDHWNEATVLNVGEGGMAVEVIAPVDTSRPFQVILDWAEVSGSIEASGEIAWRDRRRLGVRFSPLGERSHARLIEWLYQDMAARFARRENPTATPHPHGLTLPAPQWERAAGARSNGGHGDAAAGKNGNGPVRLTGLLAAESNIPAGELELPAALTLIAKRAQGITQASGTAIALGTPASAICVAKSGTLAPGLGTIIEGGQGLSGECLRTGAVVRCDDVESDPRVDRENCRRIGIRSALLVPFHDAQAAVMGMLGVFSDRTSAFDDYDLATLGRMTSVIKAASQLSSASAAAAR